MSGTLPIPWNATVSRRRDVNERVKVLWITPDSGRVQPFDPGQFVQLGWPKPEDPAGPPPTRVRWNKRSYSIASSPGESGGYELCLALVDQGVLTPRLFDLQAGERVWCDDAPKGHFTLERIPDARHLVCVATGTGIAPFVSMLRRYRGTGRFRKLTILWGARESSDLAYHEELTAAAAADPSVRYGAVVSREPAGSAWTGGRGRVQSALADAAFRSTAGEPLAPDGTHVLLCGNPAMIDDVRVLLEARGFALDTVKEPGNLHFERYW
ncbi:MAG: ferredoxin--NADP reductase [Planctomycetota bacterium]|nr:ferredoxin--NADP reductase [Planctomycetota bacterium]